MDLWGFWISIKVLLGIRQTRNILAAIQFQNLLWAEISLKVGNFPTFYNSKLQTAIGTIETTFEIT